MTIICPSSFFFFFFGTVGFERFSLDTMASQRVTYVVSSENMERLARSHGVHLVEPTAAVDQHQQQLLSLMDSSIASASTAADPLVSGYLSGFKPQDMVDFFTPHKTATPSTAVTPGAGGIQQQAASIFSPTVPEGARSEIRLQQHIIEEQRRVILALTRAEAKNFSLGVFLSCIVTTMFLLVSCYFWLPSST